MRGFRILLIASITAMLLVACFEVRPSPRETQEEGIDIYDEQWEQTETLISREDLTVTKRLVNIYDDEPVYEICLSEGKYSVTIIGAYSPASVNRQNDSGEWWDREELLRCYRSEEPLELSKLDQDRQYAMRVAVDLAARAMTHKDELSVGVSKNVVELIESMVNRKVSVEYEGRSYHVSTPVGFRGKESLYYCSINTHEANDQYGKYEVHLCTSDRWAVLYWRYLEKYTEVMKGVNYWDGKSLRIYSGQVAELKQNAEILDGVKDALLFMANFLPERDIWFADKQTALALRKSVRILTKQRKPTWISSEIAYDMGSNVEFVLTENRVSPSAKESYQLLKGTAEIAGVKVRACEDSSRDWSYSFEKSDKEHFYLHLEHSWTIRGSDFDIRKPGPTLDFIIADVPLETPLPSETEVALTAIQAISHQVLRDKKKAVELLPGECVKALSAIGERKISVTQYMGCTGDIKETYAYKGNRAYYLIDWDVSRASYTSDFLWTDVVVTKDAFLAQTSAYGPIADDLGDALGIQCGRTLDIMVSSPEDNKYVDREVRWIASSLSALVDSGVLTPPDWAIPSLDNFAQQVEGSERLQALYFDDHFTRDSLSKKLKIDWW